MNGATGSKRIHSRMYPGLRWSISNRVIVRNQVGASYRVETARARRRFVCISRRAPPAWLLIDSQRPTVSRFTQSLISRPNFSYPPTFRIVYRTRFNIAIQAITVVDSLDANGIANGATS